MLLQGTLGHDFDIFAASGCIHCLGAPLENPVQDLFDLFSTAFDPREWTLVVIWKEDLRRQLRLITSENEGRDETSSP